MGLIFKPASPAAVSMRPFAASLANSLPGQRGVKTRIMQGFIMRAVGDGKSVTVTVIEPGGFIGGTYGNLERLNHYFTPEPGRVTAMYKCALPPISTLLGGSSAQALRSYTGGRFSSYGAGGGVQIGTAPTWSSAHNLLPAGIPRSFVMPSAIMFPAVCGTEATKEIDDQPDAAANRSVLIQRLNAATQWTRDFGAGQTVPATLYGLQLNKLTYEKSPEAINYIELSSTVLNLNGGELVAGNLACLEWGALEGVVTFTAKTAIVQASTDEGVTLSPGSSGIPVDGTYSVGESFPGPVGARYAHRKVGVDADMIYRCARYSIAATHDVNSDGEPIKVYAPGVPWLIKLDGAGATGALAPDTPPASTATPPGFQDGFVSVATAWRNLWRMENVLLWSPRAGEKGGNAVEGEQIMGVGTAIVRRFRDTVKRAVTSVSGLTADDPYLPRSITWGSVPAVMTYHDRHLVRFFINPATGAVTYESLYQFVNCYLVKGNDCQYHTGVFHAGMQLEHMGADQLTAYDTDVLEGYSHRPLMGFTLVTPATETDPELREPFIACRRTRTLYDLMPTAQDWPAHPPVPGAPGGATLGPVWNDGNFLLADEGEVVLHNRPFDPFPGYPASLPYRVEKRDLTTAETVENEKLVVIGTTGNEVVMQTGDYYPDFDWGPEIAARKEKTTSTKTQFYPDRVDRGVPVCNYAPGVIAVVVIPRAQCPQPRPNWPWQNPHISPMPASPTPDLYSYSAVGASQEAYDAWKAENDANRQQVSEPDTPAPHPQSRYLALCDIRTGALLGVSTNPIHTSTARQDTPTSKHRRANIALSCVEQGARDSGTGEITRHGVVLISVRLPPKKDSFDYTEMGTTYVTLTADGGATMRSIVENAFAVPAHYLGTPMAPAKIGVTTGVAGVRGKQVMPPA